jgi:hypothetical protein
MGMEDNFNKPTASKLHEEGLQNNTIFPHGDYGIELYKKEYGENKEEIKKLEDIFTTFLNQEIYNTNIYTSEKFGVSFPYTYVDIKSFSKELYKKYKTEETIMEEKVPEQLDEKRATREFIFPGAPLNKELSDNGPFHFVGESMHQCIGRLPAAFKKIKNGENPDKFEIFMLGTPINQLGKMSPEFLKKFKENPTEVMSDVFAEFIENNSKTKESENEKLNIELYGISWGGGVAAKTGEKLLETTEFTQDLEKIKNREASRVDIRAQNPVSLSRSKMKGLQIWLGSPLNNIVSEDPYGSTVSKDNPEFTKQVNLLLEKKGIYPNMSEEQQTLKKKAIVDIVVAFRKGVNLKPETKITEVYGLKDLTTKSYGLNSEVKKQLKSFPGSVGKNLATPQRENSRVFGVDTFHEIPWFRKNELKRIHKAIENLSFLEMH